MELKWLLPDLTDGEISEILDYELPSEALEHWSVYTIRSPKLRPDGKTKVDRWEWAGLPELGNDEGPQVKKTCYFKVMPII